LGRLSNAMIRWFSFSSQVNASPYDKGWIIKVKLSDSGELNSLMDDEKYLKFCEEEDEH
jgi:glycine cleavage system H protein